MPLWEILKEVLRILKKEERIGKIQLFLEEIGIKAERKTIEAAVRLHPKEFKSRRVGRERLVGLK